MADQLGSDSSTDNDRVALLDRAIRLFKFLGRVQEMKAKTPRTVASYERDGDVLWFGRLPNHPAIGIPHPSDPIEIDHPLLTMDRVPRTAPPNAPDIVLPWLASGIDDPSAAPSLMSRLFVESPEGASSEGNDEVEEDDETAEPRLLSEEPDVTEAFVGWFELWEQWSSYELSVQPIRDVYGRLFSIHLASAGNPEEMEVTCGIGCLSWKPPDHEDVLRPAFTASVVVDFDDDSGRLTVRAQETTDTLSLELDMLDPAVIRDPQRVNEIRDSASQFASHPLDRDAVGQLGRRLVHTLDPDGTYRDDDNVPTVGPKAVIAFAPAIILRRRSQLGLVQVFESITRQLQESGVVPEGLMPLIDPNHVPDPGLLWDGTDGAMLDLDNDVFLPLPVNKAQLRIIQKVDHTAQTLVQGPPGTGKTHTAAALISHLLAQGKRVLVTAQTDRALKEVRDKLPEPIKPLSVSVVGAGREEMSDLKVAVQGIAVAASERNDAAAVAAVEHHLDHIDNLRQQRAQIHHRLLEAREVEVREYELPETRGTLASIALHHERDSERYRWIEDLIDVTPDDSPPLSDLEIAEWRSYLLNGDLASHEIEARGMLPDALSLPRPEDFSDLVRAESASRSAIEAFETQPDESTLRSLASLSVEERTSLRSMVRWLEEQITALARRPEAWVDTALREIRVGRGVAWRARQQQIASLVQHAKPLLVSLGSMPRVRCDGPSEAYVPLANTLRAQLEKGIRIKTDASGIPKLGPLTPRTIKESAPFFTAVSVDGVPPTTTASIDIFLTWAGAERTLNALNLAWPDDMVIPQEDTLSERLFWHITELELLDALVAVDSGVENLSTSLRGLGIQPLDWSADVQIRGLGLTLDCVAAQESLDLAAAPLLQLEEVIRTTSRERTASASTTVLESAVRSRDTDSYASTWDRIHRLWSVRASLERRDELGSRIEQGAPRLGAMIQADPTDESLDTHLSSFVNAWKWRALGAWIVGREQEDVNQLSAQLNAIDDEIRRIVGEIAATRAWRHAVAPSRITGEARADLELYVSLMRQLGKGTGKYAGQRRAEIRQAMDRCRPSVPVWIMPIYRIAEQLRVAPDIFDVVVVDEASQAGVEGTFLQYLAPKIVVIGDDKQVSPAGVGIDQQQLRDLANQYLYDDRYKPAWQSPLTSLFDQAKMRFGGLITLVEHRRCVPEIIGFSNQVAYEPDGIRLIPVRQFGADRLEPIKPVYLDNGYTKGESTRINPVEADAIVDQIEKCLTDPDYDGLSFGVISLLGAAQARHIESKLLERISPEEWVARDLRCGDSADFQGSERNVIFLSMVVAHDPDRRPLPVTREMFLQRYNVAASRAMDQMWLYHSIDLAELTHPEDLRRQLLDYCYGVVKRSTNADPQFQAPVPEDVRVPPFDSLFEQRVFNRLIDHGYTVVPQYETEGYRIDLVIIGSGTKVAIECDGDFWHGPDRYEADLARKRDLERCEWNFFNIRESLFYINRAASLLPLWEMLDSLGVHPSGWSRPEPTAVTDLLGDAEADIAFQRHQDLLTDPGDETAPEEDSFESRIASVARGFGTVPPSLEAVELNEPTSPLERISEFEASLDRTQATRPNARASNVDLARYESYRGQTVPALTATRDELIAGLESIVAVEGPILGSRLQQIYVKASGGHKVGKNIAHELNSAITTATRRGVFLEDNPLSEAGIKPRTYRLPTQPDSVIRQLGPRTLEEVPPKELAAVIYMVRGRERLSQNQLFRAVLDCLGLHRMTSNTVDRIAAVLPLASIPPTD